jgi:dienelactone hydrolase
MVDDRNDSKKVTFASGSHLISGWLYEPRPTSGQPPGVLFLHGLASSQRGYDGRARRVRDELGCASLTFDLSGHGLSDGQMEQLSPRDHLADAAAAYDYLVSQGHVGEGRVGVCGASYGGYLASLLVGLRPVKRLLLRAPALYDDAALDVSLGRQPSMRMDANAKLLLAVLNAYEGEILVVEGDKDEVIPPAVIQWYVSASDRAEHQIIPATHALAEPPMEQAFQAVIVNWFAHLKH